MGLIEARGNIPYINHLTVMLVRKELSRQCGLLITVTEDNVDMNSIDEVDQ